MLNFKKYFQETIKFKKSPKSIAFGAALGTFISILPTPFLNVLIGTLFILLFKNINKFSLFGSMVFWNPLTLIPVYIASYKIGDLLFGKLPTVGYEFTLLEQVFYYSRRFLVGNVILALALSAIIYGIVYKLSKKYAHSK